MDKFKIILASILVVGAFILGRQCSGTSTEYITVSDTVTVSKTDTIRDTTTVYKPRKVYDTVWAYYEIPIPQDSLTLKEYFKVRYYKEVYKDTNIVITVSDSVAGYLLTQNINYKLYRPLSITNSTTTVVNNKEPLKSSKNWQLRGGVEATLNSAYLGLEFQKDKWSYSGAYDPFNKQVKLGLYRTLLRSK